MSNPGGKEEKNEFTLLNKDEQKKKDSFEKFKEDFQKQARSAIYLEMPTKIFQINSLLVDFTIPSMKEIESNLYKEVQNMNGAGSASQTVAAPKKRKLEEGEEHIIYPQKIATNQPLFTKLELLKKELLGMIKICNLVKIWIQLNIPRIEDGNNFGVSIQEDTVTELSRAEESAFAVLDGITKFFLTRAKVVTKLIKYPNVEDYFRAVAEIDEKEFTNIHICIMDLRNNYAILHDLITKNIDKLLKPRSSNSNNMY